MKRALCCVAFVLTLATPVAASAPRAVDEAKLTQIKTEVWPGFYRRQDVKGLDAFLADVFVNIDPDGGITSKAEELDGVRASGWNPKNFRYTITRFVWLNDNLVVVVGRGESERTDKEGKPCRHGYASSNLLERTASPLGWQALSSHVSGVACTPL
jgi:hypothetical protein